MTSKYEEGGLCPHCKKDELIPVYTNGVYSDDYLYCPTCDSTYPIEG